jgi:cytochrome c-type biogenesis protein CcmH
MSAVIRFVLVLLALLVFPLALHATDPEREARAIEDLLMAPCCFRQQVSVHQSPTATQVQRDIRKRLAAGESRQTILDAYVAEYGEGILVVPPATGSNLVLYVLPPLTLAGSVLLVVGVIRRFSMPGAGRPALPQPAGDAAAIRMLDDRLTDELRDLD